MQSCTDQESFPHIFTYLIFPLVVEGRRSRCYITYEEFHGPGSEALLWGVLEQVTLEGRVDGCVNLQVEWFLVMTRPRVCPWELVSEEERKKKPLDN